MGEIGGELGDFLLRLVAFVVQCAFWYGVCVGVGMTKGCEQHFGVRFPVWERVFLWFLYGAHWIVVMWSEKAQKMLAVTVATAMEDAIRKGWARVPKDPEKD